MINTTYRIGPVNSTERMNMVMHRVNPIGYDQPYDYGFEPNLSRPVNPGLSPLTPIPISKLESTMDISARTICAGRPVKWSAEQKKNSEWLKKRKIRRRKKDIRTYGKVILRRVNKQKRPA